MSSDTALNSIIQYGTRSARIAFTPSPASGSQILYIWYETDHAPDTWVWNGSAWVQINPGGGSGNVNAAGTLLNHALVIGQGSTDVATLAGLGTNHQVLHGAAAGDPSFSAVDLANDVTGTLASSHLSTPAKTRQIVFNFDGGGSALTTGDKHNAQYIDYDCTIIKATLYGDGGTGSIVVDIYASNYAGFPPVVGGSITASAKPTISAAKTAQDSTLTGWTTAISAGTFLLPNIDSVSSFIWAGLVLTVTVG